MDISIESTQSSVAETVIKPMCVFVQTDDNKKVNPIFSEFCMLNYHRAQSNFVFLKTLFTEEEYSILPSSLKRNLLHEALENRRFEEASKLIGLEMETDLVECFKSTEKISKSCLHLIAATHDSEQATELCRQLLRRISNATNREYLLNMTTVDEFKLSGKTVHARVAAIHIAAYMGNAGIVRLFCQEHGVDVNCSTSETLGENPTKRITALHWAARNGHTDVVKVLLDSKVDVNVGRPADGVTPLHIAAQERHTEVAKLLLDNKADINARVLTYGATPLYIASQSEHRDIVDLLLAYNADVNASCTDDGATPLHIVSWSGNTQLVKLLLDHKADVNASRHTDGATPLYAAAQNGHTEVVKLLLDNSANVNASVHTDGSTPLYIASQNHCVEVVKLLLENKADVNAACTDDDATPLFIAAEKGNTEVVKVLLDNGADVNLRACNGEKPVDAARRNHHSDTAELLK